MNENTYRELIISVKNQFTVKIGARLVIAGDQRLVMSEKELDRYVEDDLMHELATEMNKFVRKAVTNDPRTGNRIYENSILVEVDPTGMIERMEKELYAAYQHGYENGLLYAELNGWKRVFE